MTIKKAISEADDLRMNAIDEEKKYGWIFNLENQIAEMMDVEAPENIFPEDGELLMPAAYEDVYQLYIVAMIDFYNQEMALYANDMEMFNQRMGEARAWWIRNNRPEKKNFWRTM